MQGERESGTANRFAKQIRQGSGGRKRRMIQIEETSDREGERKSKTEDRKFWKEAQGPREG
jgi:hypothetical protein